MYCVTSNVVCKLITYIFRNQNVELSTWALSSHLFLCLLDRSCYSYTSFQDIFHYNPLINFREILEAVLGHVVANQAIHPVRIDICPTNF